MSTGIQGQSSAQPTTKSFSNQLAPPPPLSSLQAPGQEGSLGMPSSLSSQERGIRGSNTEAIMSSKCVGLLCLVRCPKPFIVRILCLNPRCLHFLPGPLANCPPRKGHAALDFLIHLRCAHRFLAVPIILDIMSLVYLILQSRLSHIGMTIYYFAC